MCAAELTIWSRASRAKFTVIISTTGRRPVIAAPTPMPTIVFSEIGVSRTRFSPNCSSRPFVTLKAPWKTPMSSPMRKTRSSRSISSRSASLSASRYRMTAMSVLVLLRLVGGLLVVVGARVVVARLGGGRVEALHVGAVPRRALVDLLALANAGAALVDRVPAPDLVAEHVDVVVERLGRREGRLVGVGDRLVDALDGRAVEVLEPGPVEH